MPAAVPCQKFSSVSGVTGHRPTSFAITQAKWRALSPLTHVLWASVSEGCRSASCRPALLLTETTEGRRQACFLSVFQAITSPTLGHKTARQTHKRTPSSGVHSNPTRAQEVTEMKGCDRPPRTSLFYRPD